MVANHSAKETEDSIVDGRHTFVHFAFERLVETETGLHDRIGAALVTRKYLEDETGKVYGYARKSVRYRRRGLARAQKRAGVYRVDGPASQKLSHLSCLIRTDLAQTKSRKAAIEDVVWVVHMCMPNNV
jgi:hypothetical protein